MTNRISIIFPIALLVFSCRQSDTTEMHGHPHEEGPAPLAYTLYTDKTELFVEFKPLVVGESSRFAAHFTKLPVNTKRHVIVEENYIWVLLEFLRLSRT